MRNFVFIALILSLTWGFSACNDDDNSDLNVESLPLSARQFLKDNFPDITCSSVKRGDKNEEAIYKIQLSNGVSIDFNESGYWLKIKSETQLPELLLQNISPGSMSKIRAELPDITFLSIEQVIYGYQLRTETGKRLALFNFDSWGYEQPNESLPEEARRFVGRYFSWNNYRHVIQTTEADQTTYIVYLDNQFILHFDKNGSWTEARGIEEKPLPSDFKDVFPQAVRDYIREKYPDIQIYHVFKYNAYYQLYIGNGTSLLIDPETGVFIYPTDKIQTFVRTHFSQSNNIQMTIKENRTTETITFDCSYIIRDEDYAISMQTDKYGEWNYLRLAGNKVPSMPESILNLLPFKVKDYIATHYPEKKIIGIKKNPLPIEIQFEEDLLLSFDSEGKLLN